MSELSYSIRRYRVTWPRRNRLGGTLYAVWEAGQNQCNFDRLLSSDIIVQGPYYRDFMKLAARIQEMASSTGFLPDFFRSEPGFEMFPRTTSEARICTQRYSTLTLILGGGGIKRRGTAAYQDCPGLNEAAGQMQSVGKSLTQFLENTNSAEDPSGGFVDRYGLPLDVIRLT